MATYNNLIFNESMPVSIYSRNYETATTTTDYIVSLYKANSQTSGYEYMNPTANTFYIYSSVGGSMGTIYTHIFGWTFPIGKTIYIDTRETAPLFWWDGLEDASEDFGTNCKFTKTFQIANGEITNFSPSESNNYYYWYDYRTIDTGNVYWWCSDDWVTGTKAILMTDVNPAHFKFNQHSPSPYYGAKLRVTYYLPDDNYEYAKITYKKDEKPANVDDGDSVTIVKNSMIRNIEGLDIRCNYWFTIFTNKSESESVNFNIRENTYKWQNAILPDPMVTGTLFNDSIWEELVEMHHVVGNCYTALGFDNHTYGKSSPTYAWLFNNIINRNSGTAFWIFGNNQRGIYVYWKYETYYNGIYIRVFYKGNILVDELIGTAEGNLNSILLFGYNDESKVGSLINVRDSSLGYSIFPFLLNSEPLYYFITNKPNPNDYTWYINNINGTGFTWKDLPRNSGSGYIYYPFSNYSQWRSAELSSNSAFDIMYPEDNTYVFQTDITRVDITTEDYSTYSVTLDPTGIYTGAYYDNLNTYQYYTVGKPATYRNNRIIRGDNDTPVGFPYTYSGTLENVLTQITSRCKNVDLYVAGECWSKVSS